MTALQEDMTINGGSRQTPATTDPPKTYTDNSQAMLVDYIKKAHKNMTKQSRAMDNLIPVGQTKEEADKHQAILWQIQQQNRKARLEKARLEKPQRSSRKATAGKGTIQMSRKERRELAQQRRDEEAKKEESTKEAEIEAKKEESTKEAEIEAKKEEPTKEDSKPEVPIPEEATQHKAPISRELTPEEKKKISLLKKIRKLQAKRSVNRTK